MATFETNHDDLNWLAFRYVAGEMATDEAAVFEDRLFTEQAAREAVAAAVELTHAVACSSRNTSVVTRDAEQQVVPAAAWRWLRPVEWMVVGAAACLVVMLFLQSTRSERNDVQVVRGAGSNSSPSTTSDRLALVWSQTRGDSDEAANEVTADANTEDSVTAETELMIGDALVSTDTLEGSSHRTPSWIIAAVSGLKEESAMEEMSSDFEEL